MKNVEDRHELHKKLSIEITEILTGKDLNGNEVIEILIKTLSIMVIDKFNDPIEIIDFADFIKTMLIEYLIKLLEIRN